MSHFTLGQSAQDYQTTSKANHRKISPEELKRDGTIQTSIATFNENMRTNFTNAMPRGSEVSIEL